MNSLYGNNTTKLSESVVAIDKNYTIGSSIAKALIEGAKADMELFEFMVKSDYNIYTESDKEEERKSVAPSIMKKLIEYVKRLFNMISNAISNSSRTLTLHLISNNEKDMKLVNTCEKLNSEEAFRKHIKQKFENISNEELMDLTKKAIIKTNAKLDDITIPKWRNCDPTFNIESFRMAIGSDVSLNFADMEELYKDNEEKIYKHFADGCKTDEALREKVYRYFFNEYKPKEVKLKQIGGFSTIIKIFKNSRYENIRHVAKDKINEINYTKEMIEKSYFDNDAQDMEKYRKIQAVLSIYRDVFLKRLKFAEEAIIDFYKQAKAALIKIYVVLCTGNNEMANQMANESAIEINEAFHEPINDNRYNEIMANYEFLSFAEADMGRVLSSSGNTSSDSSSSDSMSAGSSSSGGIVSKAASAAHKVSDSMNKDRDYFADYKNQASKDLISKQGRVGNMKEDVKFNLKMSFIDFLRENGEESSIDKLIGGDQQHPTSSEISKSMPSDQDIDKSLSEGYFDDGDDFFRTNKPTPMNTLFNVVHGIVKYIRACIKTLGKIFTKAFSALSTAAVNDKETVRKYGKYLKRDSQRIEQKCEIEWRRINRAYSNGNGYLDPSIIMNKVCYDFKDKLIDVISDVRDTSSSYYNNNKFLNRDELYSSLSGGFDSYDHYDKLFNSFFQGEKVKGRLGSFTTVDKVLRYVYEAADRNKNINNIINKSLSDLDRYIDNSIRISNDDYDYMGNNNDASRNIINCAEVFRQISAISAKASIEALKTEQSMNRAALYRMIEFSNKSSRRDDYENGFYRTNPIF